MKKLEIGTIYYPDGFPDLDKVMLVNAIGEEVERQMSEAGRGMPEYIVGGYGKVDFRPSISDRFKIVLNAAEEATGYRLTKARSRSNTILRSFIASRLRREGYSNREVGKMLHRDHSTVSQYAQMIDDMLSVPEAYKLEIEMFMHFERILNG